jgi:hypothetical protein
MSVAYPKEVATLGKIVSATCLLKADDMQLGGSFFI